MRYFHCFWHTTPHTFWYLQMSVKLILLIPSLYSYSLSYRFNCTTHETLRIQCNTWEKIKLHELGKRYTLPMRVVDEGGVEGRATVAAYDWLAGCGGTSSRFSSSFCSSCSSLDSKSLEEDGRQRLYNTVTPKTSIYIFFL